jgi:hypothetical protein
LGIKKKCIKIARLSQMWWYMPVISATQEAGSGGWLESRNSRSAWARSQKNLKENKAKT